MITTIIIVSIAFFLLALETDYFRIRLLVGEYISPVVYRRTTWRELCPQLYDGTRRTGSSGKVHSKQDASFVRLPHNYIPLCGWDWLENTNHVLPDYSLDLNINNIRYKISFEDGATARMLEEVIKVNTKKHKPYSLPRGKSLGPEPTNPNWIQVRLSELEYEPEAIGV